MEAIQAELGPHGSRFPVVELIFLFSFLSLGFFFVCVFSLCLLLTSMQAKAASRVMGLQTLETIQPSRTILPAEPVEWKQTAI